MKTLITEQKFLDSLVNCAQSDNSNDFIDFLKNDFFGYDLICDFNTVEEYKAASKRNPLWELMMDKYENILFNSALADDLKDDNFYLKLGEHNIFLVDQNEKVCEKMTNERGYLFVSISNLSNVWEKFKLLNKGFHFKVTNSALIPNEQKLDCWTKLQDLFFPSTSIVIFDKYLLSDKSNQKMIDNLFPLLDIICHNSTSLKNPLNISIIAEFDVKGNIENSYNVITNYLKLKTWNNVHINILKHHKSQYPPNFEGLHSRFILSNYFHFKCDDSFNFFKPNRKINNDADLRVDFCLSKKHKHFFKKELNDVKKYIDRLTNDPSRPSQDMRILYCHDKQNYLVN